MQHSLMQHSLRQLCPIAMFTVALSIGCGEDEEENAAAACIEAEEAYPISTALNPGPTSSAFYNTVSPFEYADIQRSHIHPADFFGADSGEETLVSERALSGTHESMYNVVTRDRNEAFVYGTDPVPFVVKFNLDDGSVVWRTELPILEDNFTWVGLVAVHGNGDVYAVHSRTLVRIDPVSGDILARVDLPPSAGSAARDTVYNGFTIAPNGLIIGKSYGRPEGCEESGTAAIVNCVDEDNPQPPSAIVSINPETLEVISQIDLPEVATGRPAVSEYQGQEYIYLNSADNVYRVRLEEDQVVVDDTWQYGGFLTEDQSGSSSVVVMGDWVTFQTNGTPSAAPMTVHIVSQADDGVATSLAPFSPSSSTSFTPSSVTADLATMSVYSQDCGRGQIARLQFDESTVSLSASWVVDQRTLNHLTLIGPEDERVLVTTDAPNAVAGFLAGVPYEEQVVWRSAETGEELARSEILPSMFFGGPITPGFDGVLFYLGLDGTARELSTAGSAPVCE